MRDPSERLQRAIDGLRGTWGPSADVEARMLTTLEQRLDGPPDDGGGGTGGEGGGVGQGQAGGLIEPISASWAAKVVAATTAMTGAGLLFVWGIATVVEVSSPTSERVTRASALEPPPAPLPAREPPLEPLAHPESPKPRSQPEPNTRVERAATTAPTRAKRARAAASAVPSSRRELELLTRARKLDDASAALTLLEQHAREYPAGLLIDEREALRAMSLCRLGRLDEARSVALTLVDKRPSSPLRERMRDACPELQGALEP